MTNGPALFALALTLPATLIVGLTILRRRMSQQHGSRS